MFFFIYSLLAAVGEINQVEAQQSDCNGPSVCRLTIRPDSRTPAARTGYEVTFVTPSELNALTDSIVMVLDEEIGVPRGISSLQVRIRYRTRDSYGNGIAGDVSLADHANRRRPTTITITPAVRVNGRLANIPEGSSVTVAFDRNAGISNPSQGGAFSWTVHTSKDPRPVAAVHPSGDVRRAFRQASGDGSDIGLLVDREIHLSQEEVVRGDRIRVTARGYRAGSSLAVWRDADMDGQQESAEGELCRTEVGANGVAYCYFTVAAPPFAPALGECGASHKNCNLINGVDGSRGTSIILDEDPSGLDQVLELVGRIKRDPVQGPDGDIEVELIDFPPGVITLVEIGGAPAEVGQLRVGATGSLRFKVPLPVGARLGRQSFQVTLVRDDNGQRFTDSAYVNIKRFKTQVWVLPETVLPNQRVSIRGVGFNPGEEGEAAIVEMNIGGFVLDASRINHRQGSIDIDEDGDWSGYLELPIIEPTLVQGSHSLQVKDSRGRTGSAEIKIPPRELTLSPIWGRPGSLVTVAGKGFPARNDGGSDVNLRIHYESSAGLTTASAETDSDGNFSREIRIPFKTMAPSSNTVRVEFDDDNGVTVVTAAPHEVPGATVTLSPASGPPGTPVTLVGAGFRQFAKVNSATIGPIDVTPAKTATTDFKGEFSFAFLAPGIGAGIHTVRVSVAGIEAGSTFDISPSGVAPGGATPVEEAMKNLGESFLRSFHFDNDAKTWSFYDPRSAEDSTQQFMLAGETYFILVRKTSEAVLNGKPRVLTCYQRICWNQIVW